MVLPELILWHNLDERVSPDDSPLCGLLSSETLNEK